MKQYHFIMDLSFLKTNREIFLLKYFEDKLSIILELGILVHSILHIILATYENQVHVSDILKKIQIICLGNITDD